uniref:Uncharacterized protein n=1 Tax=Anopheles atroparvus TaxID=41427 RepID=A0A182IXX3_ANOAO
MQLSEIRNVYGRQLDLILGNTAAADVCGAINTAALHLLPEDTHHPALELCLSVDTPATVRANHPSSPGGSRDLNFRKLDRVKLARLIQEYDWSFLDTNGTIDEDAANFTSAVSSVLSSCCPISYPSPRPLWSDGHLRALKSDFKRALRAHRISRSERHLRTLKYAASAYRSYNRSSVTWLTTPWNVPGYASKPKLVQLLWAPLTYLLTSATAALSLPHTVTY